MYSLLVKLGNWYDLWGQFLGKNSISNIWAITEIVIKTFMIFAAIFWIYFEQTFKITPFLSSGTKF